MSKQTDKLNLKVENRSIIGRKVKKLRKEGTIPANIYGQDIKSISIQIKLKEFTNVYRIAKETIVVYLDLKGEKIPTLIKNLQRHPVSNQILHVDFRKIDLKKKVETEVPVKIIGSSEAVTQKAGVLLVQSETLLVEALPENIPSHFEVDISQIKEIGQEIKVTNLPKSDKYEIKTPGEKVIVSVIAHKEESITPETTTAAPEVITEKPEEGETTEGAPTTTPTESAPPKEGVKPPPAEKAKETKK